MPTPNCKICSGRTTAFGEKRGNLMPMVFRFCRCEVCNFVSVVNPCLDFGVLYNEDYYRGRGADPYVDYCFELEHPERTIRQYEWRGIHSVIQRLAPHVTESRWLDYGCGNGGLVRYLRKSNIDAVGFDEGAIVPIARAKDIPVLSPSELQSEAERFSVITMIEVIEHVPDPMSLLRTVRSLLKPGGLLFLTTGNSAPHLHRFVDWGYVIPDIHVSYFNPHNMQMALAANGFKAESVDRVRGWDDIIRFKVLKTLGWRKMGLLERLVPWKIASPLIDSHMSVSHHPIGWAV